MGTIILIWEVEEPGLREGKWHTFGCTGDMRHNHDWNLAFLASMELMV